MCIISGHGLTIGVMDNESLRTNQVQFVIQALEFLQSQTTIQGHDMRRSPKYAELVASPAKSRPPTGSAKVAGDEAHDLF